MRGAACTASRVGSRRRLRETGSGRRMAAPPCRGQAPGTSACPRSRAMGSPPHVPTSRGRTGPRGAHRHRLGGSGRHGESRGGRRCCGQARFGLPRVRGGRRRACSRSPRRVPPRPAAQRGARTPALLPRERGSRAGGRPPSPDRGRRAEAAADDGVRPDLDGPSGIGNALLIGTYARLVDRAIATE